MIQDRRTGGRRKGGMQDGADKGQEGFRKEVIKERRTQERKCMHERWAAGHSEQVGCRSGGKRNEEMHERKDPGNKGRTMSNAGKLVSGN